VTDQPHRRRIDQVLAPDFIEGTSSLDLEELRSRRDLAEEVERELSFHRRLIHGRMDLLAFELRRRRGEETRSLIEALPEIIASGLTGGSVGSYRHLSVDITIPEITGRREIDQVLEDDALARVTTMEDAELAEVQMALTEAEATISEKRRQLHAVIDMLQAEIIDRYKRGLATTDLSS
jgi:hypothetical protein